MILGIVPAAGKSQRMGRPKLTLPLGGRAILEHVLAALRSGGVGPVLVVVGPHVPELATLAGACGAYALRLTDETADMRATVQRGLAWLEERFQPTEADDFLLVPADQPSLDGAVVRQLLDVRAGLTSGAVVVPTFAGRRGHPVLLGWGHVAGIRNLPAGQGIDVYLRQQGGLIHEVKVDSAEILADVDTPEDYERWRRFWPGGESGSSP